MCKIEVRLSLDGPFSFGHLRVHNVLRSRILRAFLVEEAKIVKKVIKSQQKTARK